MSDIVWSLGKAFYVNDISVSQLTKQIFFYCSSYFISTEKQPIYRTSTAWEEYCVFSIS